jgi:hypothetical protein
LSTLPSLALASALLLQSALLEGFALPFQVARDIMVQNGSTYVPLRIRQQLGSLNFMEQSHH